MWGWGVLLTMVVILREEFFGKYATKDPFLFSLAYGGYMLMIWHRGRVLRVKPIT